MSTTLRVRLSQLAHVGCFKLGTASTWAGWGEGENSPPWGFVPSAPGACLPGSVVVDGHADSMC